ncbi:MAG TPA: hypothetical protein VLV81_07510 [Acidimicrobiia bacterium]|nr:hypothetical protein [Acidimicrobiia bacterium]
MTQPAALPARDREARARLAGIAGRVRPTVLARDRTLVIPGPLGEILPEGLMRGSVLVVDGSVGAGVTSAAVSLCAAATAVGEWAGAVDLHGTWGGEALAELGVAERFVVVRRVPPDRWATTVSVLLDGMSVVVADVPRQVRAGEARRLVARARERGVVLVPVLFPPVQWPATATHRLHVGARAWSGLELGSGLLRARPPVVRISDARTTRERGVLAS